MSLLGTILAQSINISYPWFQVATIARPPVDPSHKQPSTLATGYIICIYQVNIFSTEKVRNFILLMRIRFQVFKGDDGEKFERNWLYWTGRD